MKGQVRSSSIIEILSVTSSGAFVVLQEKGLNSLQNIEERRDGVAVYIIKWGYEKIL
ncbi:MAG: hypothetical protein K6E27_07540 [Eubacterium sp.]|nr:hypothetical protein [Eubacterium sp.]